MAVKMMMAPPESSNTLLQFLQRIHPRSCLPSGCLKSMPFEEDEEEEYSIQRVPYLIKALSVSDLSMMEDDQLQLSDRRLRALETLYAFTGKKELRVPIVCTTKWDVCTALANCLDHNITMLPNSTMGDADEIRRLTCLILNNLSIPFENKAVMVFGPGSKLLLQKLVLLISLRVPEAYLCCICLVNLSYMDDALDIFINYSPLMAANPSIFRSSATSTTSKSSLDLRTIHLRASANSKKSIRSDSATIQQAFSPTSSRPSSRNPSPARQCSIHSMTPALDDPNSLLRVLEKLLQAYRPFLMSTVLSIEGEAVRWAIVFLRNLTRIESSCILISQTDIPPLLVSIIRNSPHLVESWQKDSLEEHCLALLGNLVSCDKGILALRECHATQVLEKIVGKGGLYDFRVTLILEALGDSNYR